MISSLSKRERAASSSSAAHNLKNRRFGGPQSASIRGQSAVPGTITLPSSSRYPSSRALSSNASRVGYEPEDDSQIRDREENDDMSQVIMAVDMNNKGAVGCSYYVAREEKLYLLQDVKAGGEAVIEALKIDIEPTVVLQSSRVRPDNERSGENRAPFEDSDDDRFKLPYKVEFQPNQEYKLENARSRLLSLRLSSYNDQVMRFLVPGDGMGEDGHDLQADLGYSGQQGKFLYLSSVVDMENCITIGCAGAVLAHLQRMRASAYLPGDHAANALFRVSGIEMFALKETMFVNSDTLNSLQVLQSESHPNAFNQGPGKASSGSKESLSVYGLFHHLARTPQGKQELRKLFLRPSLNIDTINGRLDFISVFLQPDNGIAVEKIVQGLKRIKNLHPVIVHLHKGISAGNNKFGSIQNGVWTTLLSFAFHSLDVQIAVREVSNGQLIPLLNKVIEKLDPRELHNVGSLIHGKIDLEASIVQHRAVVKRGINEELDAMKETYEGMDDLLAVAAKKIASGIPVEHDLNLNVIYFPQIGFLVTMPASNADGVIEEGFIEEGKWERMFTSENQVYYKEFRTKEMDEQLGDIYALICDMEIEIVHELAQEILKYEAMLLEASDVCGELDSLLALAQGAKQHNFNRPRITEENVIEIRAGRHPLQELTVPSYVNNDTLLAGGNGDDGENPSGNRERQASEHDRQEQLERPSMLVLTGPNYSGKSVYQKQVALIVYMVHVGSFVPAESARIGLTDKILTRMTTRETVSKIQSAFLIDLQQISLALTLATRRSLLIIDEFGKGTDSNDGAGLCCGVLEYLLSLGEDRPRVLAATHFHEIFEHGFLPPRPELSFGHMEVLVDPRAKNVEGQITYLYNLRKGKNNTSFGTSCAAMNGIDPAIVERANQLSLYAARGDDLLAVCAEISPEEEEKLMEAEAIARAFVRKNFSSSITNGSEGNTTSDPRTTLEEVLTTMSTVAESS